MKKNILVFCAHSDDEVIGIGGTIARYSSRYNITIVILSFGESSTPHIKREIAVKTRVKEAKEIAEILGIHQTIFLGLQDQRLIKYIKNKKTINIIKKLIQKHKPVKIFTHSPDDPNMDHLGTHRIIKKALINLKYPLYTFEIWSPIKLIERDVPKLYVDISKTYKKKMEALKIFKSQAHFIYPLLPLIQTRAIVNGKINNCKYAEKFYKVK